MYDVIVSVQQRKLNHDKILHEQFHGGGNRESQKSLTYCGYVFSAAGVSPELRKVKAIHDAPPPTGADLEL